MTVLFSELPIISEIQSALRSLGYENATPIQAGAIPPLLAGKDLLGCAQTGTGKTAAFAIPLLQHLQTKKARATPFEPRALILAPTRELVVQISENFAAIGRNTRIRHTLIYGGVGQRPQVAALTQGVHAVIATPGRLLDLVDQQYCNLANLEYFVLDEADRMLDMGFMPEIQRIIRLLPREKQSVFLSATMPPPIKSLAGALLHEHVTVMIAPPATTAERVHQRVMFVEKGDKRKLLDHLLADPNRTRILVFMRTKYGADRMYKSLIESGVSAEGIHGGRSQNARQRVLNAFKDGSIRVLIATDVAARGIDIDDISHVINFEVPQDADNYVHRIGRTARAGAAGESITFCEGEEFQYFKEIEKTIGMSIQVDRDHPYHSVAAEDEELREAGRWLDRRNMAKKAKGQNYTAIVPGSTSKTRRDKSGRPIKTAGSSKLSGAAKSPRGDKGPRAETSSGARSKSGKLGQQQSVPATVAPSADGSGNSSRKKFTTQVQSSGAQRAEAGPETRSKVSSSSESGRSESTSRGRVRIQLDSREAGERSPRTRTRGEANDRSRSESRERGPTQRGQNRGDGQVRDRGENNDEGQRRRSISGKVRKVKPRPEGPTKYASPFASKSKSSRLGKQGPFQGRSSSRPPQGKSASKSRPSAKSKRK